MQFADPKNDLAFKKIFGNEKHKEIVDVSLANPYQVSKIPELKEIILDIKAKNKKGKSFIVEMQKRYLGDFAKRSLYYMKKIQ